MKRIEKRFSVTCTGLPDMFFYSPGMAVGYAFNLAIGRGSDVDLRIKYGDIEITRMHSVVCSPVIDELCERFADPDGKDRAQFIEALKAEKNRLVFHLKVYMENVDGNSYLTDSEKECFERFMEYFKRMEEVFVEKEFH